MDLDLCREVPPEQDGNESDDFIPRCKVFTVPFRTAPGDVGTQRNLYYRHLLGGLPACWSESSRTRVEETEAVTATQFCDSSDSDGECASQAGCSDQDTSTGTSACSETGEDSGFVTDGSVSGESAQYREASSSPAFCGSADDECDMTDGTWSVSRAVTPSTGYGLSQDSSDRWSTEWESAQRHPLALTRVITEYRAHSVYSHTVKLQ